jgi:hypothetical protein
MKNRICIVLVRGVMNSALIKFLDKGKFPFQMTDEEYLEKIEYYKIKVKELSKQKGIKI